MRKSQEHLLAELQEKIATHNKLKHEWEEAHQAVCDAQYIERVKRIALNTAARDCYDLFEQMGIRPHDSIAQFSQQGNFSQQERETVNG